jgi:hypothetical protein
VASEKKAASGKQASAPAEKKAHTTAPRSEKRCREKDCKHHYKAKGYCVKHYRQWRHGKLGKKQRYKICGKEGCRKPMVRWGLCEEHYKAQSETAAPAATPAAPA